MAFTVRGQRYFRFLDDFSFGLSSAFASLSGVAPSKWLTSKGFWQVFKDDQGNISSARVMSIWGYWLLTILVAVELCCGKTVGREGLYLWLIGASAGGKAAGKYFEQPM